MAEKILVDGFTRAPLLGGLRILDCNRYIDRDNLFYNYVKIGSNMSVDVEDVSVIAISAKPLEGYAMTGWYEGSNLVAISTAIDYS